MDGQTHHLHKQLMDARMHHLQSAYRRHHSTETALLKISNDIFEAVASGNATVLVAPDLSAAFDTIDHSVLINRLEYTLVLGVLTLEWVKSYIGGRTSFIKIGGERSATTGVVTGVLQGSVLGSILFFTLCFAAQQCHLQARHPIPTIC